MRKAMEGVMGKALGFGRENKFESLCDVCGRDRARWFCAADEAHLCNKCDASVHSANAVARRHERVPFEPSSPTVPKRARSSRSHFSAKSKDNGDTQKRSTDETKVHTDKLEVTVPGSEESYQEDDELVVPSLVTADDDEDVKREIQHDDEGSFVDLNRVLDCDLENFDVDSIIGSHDFEDHGLGDLGFANCNNGNFNRVKIEEGRVKKEVDMDADWDTIELNINVDEEDEDSSEAPWMNMLMNMSNNSDVKTELDLGSVFSNEANYIEKGVASIEKKISLRLDYDDVLNAWSDRGSLWASSLDCDSDATPCNEASNSSMSGGGMQMGGFVGNVADDASRRDGREARVLRYREKRRTRLFSKKIRYEVRKLNAEKRPRMKGRFVKRTSGGQCE